MQQHRWIGWLAVMAIAFVLAGCGSSTDNTNSAQSGNNGQQQEAASGAEQVQDQPEPEQQTRTVRDEFGDVVVPAKPQRVAAIYLEDYLKMLGVEPVVQWYHPTWGQQDYLELDAPLFDMSGNIEALLEHDPDLIIVDGAVDAATYEMYSKIAPTYRLPESVLLDPGAILTTIADVLGIPEQAEAALTLYDETMANTKQQLQAAVGDETVAVLRLNIGDKTMALFGVNNRYTGNIYHQMGLTPHPWARDMEAFQQVLSEEAIPDLNADHIILFTSNGDWDSTENQDAVKSLDNPLWNSLPAVKNGHVYIVGRTHWQSGALRANLMKSEDLLRLMVK